jgi:hypothetical protein
MYLSKIQLSFASLLTIPRVGSSTAGFWKCPLKRHFSREGFAKLGSYQWSALSFHGRNGYQKWSPEEDAKILELHR